MVEDGAWAVVDGEDLGPLCALADGTRRHLYAYVAAQGRPVTRDEASSALDIDRSLAAYHLDKLVDQGLLTASFARAEGRRGPGAGRPAKRYERAGTEFAVSIPPRDYGLAAEVLARAVRADGSGSVRRAVDEAAADLGRELAEAAGAREVPDVLARHGFEPYDDGGVVRLRNCPFNQLAERHAELVCAMNLAMLGGVVAALSADVRVALEPGPGRCCVALRRLT